MAYAESTKVPVAKSKAELAALVTRHGATAVAQFQEQIGDGRERSSVAFRVGRASFRFEVTTPPLREYSHTKQGRTRTIGQQEAMRDQAHRQRWRALLLFVRAALEAVEQRAFRLEEALLPWAITPRGNTVGAELAPRLLEHAEVDPAHLLPAPQAAERYS